MKSFDLLSTVVDGGCSCKLPAQELAEVLANLPGTPHENLLVNTDHHDDAGVYKLTEEMALIQTTDFFSPLCSDPYEFGQIAAANALSDVYAMGGEVLTALNLAAFPAKIPLTILKEILRGGIEKVKEAGGIIMGGHTIVDDVPKFGLAVTGTVHPAKIITNAAAKPGNVLILTKPIGAGIIMAGHRLNETSDENLQTVLDTMKILNRRGSQIMQQYGVKAATDVTGFGLAGHALKMALASQVTLKISPANLPCFDTAYALVETGCIPGACFRNLDFVEPHCRFEPTTSFNQKMLVLDAQTSGGLLICCPSSSVDAMLLDLKKSGYPFSAVIGEVVEKEEKALVVG
ncbi:MAG: selenide, water dikinase SelD [Bacteroidetes bacterium HGW-Bacteroidetes-21]|jgi:selenide,water dikinase|nr:MAG: selenide, water dikinase SelD [Bacteroidetes bacterium HGW-Bacteroidetes-21]